MLADALLIVDYTNDFIADKGALTCGAPGQAIDSFIAASASAYLDHDAFIVVASDLHVANDAYHPENKLFPPHNLKGTWGRQLFGTTGTWYAAHADDPHVLTMAKTRYDAFTGTNLDLMLRARHVKSVAIVGVCTDICILHTAIGAYNLGYSLVIPEKGVATFNPEGQSFALNHFKAALGATVVS